MSKLQWVVAPSESGERLDRFLAQADRLGSRAKAATAIERGKVFLNEDEAGRSSGAGRLRTGDVVRVWMDRPGSARARARVPRAGQLDILFEDAVLLVVNKPAGLLAVPIGAKEDAISLADLVRVHLRSQGKVQPQVVHRIDRDTSGLVVFAKTALAQQRLKEQFKRREPERVYQAVVYGHPDPPEGTWSDRLVWDQRSLIQKSTHPRDPQGKDALSDYRVVRRFRDASLIEVRLITGKRNQIRLQARLRGHTLVGEQRYTYGPSTLRPIDFPRQALHAWRLGFRHPVDDRSLQFEAPLPEDMTDLLRGLER